MKEIQRILGEIEELIDSLKQKHSQLAVELDKLKKKATSAEIPVTVHPADTAVDVPELELAPPAKEKELPPQEQEETEKPPTTLEERLIEKLSGLASVIKEHQLEVAVADVAFTTKSKELFENFSRDEKEGEKGNKLLFEVLKFIDQLLYRYGTARYKPLTERAHPLCAEIITHLEEKAGFMIFPHTKDRSIESLKTYVEGFEKAVVLHPVESTEPSGTILNVKSRGAYLHSTPYRRAEILISAEKTTEAGTLLNLAYQTVMQLTAKEKDAKAAKLKAGKSIQSWFEELAGADADYILTVVRYTLNLLTEAYGEKLFPHQEKQLKKVIEKLVTHLKNNGLREVYASIGDRFDESYSPGKYERKKVKSDQARGTIVAVLQRGFLDNTGVPVQKARLAVSSGS